MISPLSPSPSFTIDVETATKFRDWLFKIGVSNHDNAAIAGSLAELAAAIDGQLHDSTEYVEISASTTAFPPTDHFAVGDGNGSSREQATNDSIQQATSTDIDTDPDQLYDQLHDAAWQRSSSPSTASEHSRSPTVTSHPQRDRSLVAGPYRTAFECSVCGCIREIEMSLQVCAFVDDCDNCGAVTTKFTAVGIPEPIHDCS